MRDLTKEERDEIVAQQLNTPYGKRLFARAFYQGINHFFRVPEAEGNVIIEEFYEKYGTTRGLPTYLIELRERLSRRPTLH